MVEYLASLKAIWSAITSLIGWRSRRARERAVTRLSELRVEAVNQLLNRRVASPADFERWVTDKDSWRASVLTVLRADFKPAVAHSFETLGVIGAKTFAMAYDGTHNWHLNMLDKELDILNKIVDRYTP